MRASRASSELSDPGAAGWSSVESEVLTLAPVPLDAQPTDYIRAAWADRTYGKVGQVTAAAAHDGESLYVRLEWAGSDAEGGEFPDAAALLVPTDDASPASTMGSADHPVEVAYWQANLSQAKALLSCGPGVVAPAGDGVAAAASGEGGRWAVVLRRPLGDTGRVGVAVWDGSNEERAGIGAVTPEWVSLDVER